MIALWQDAKRRQEDCVLATVVRVEGSSYRKPGARMLVTAGGRRAGTISGGCLEAEVTRRAFWLTEQGSTIQRYQSSFDEDGGTPFGLGCGGTIFVLLERGRDVDEVMSAIEESVARRAASAIVTVIDANSELAFQRLILSESGDPRGSLSEEPALILTAKNILIERRSSWHKLTVAGACVAVFAEHLPRVTSVIIFGAGDDAQPVVGAAIALGWQVTVVDGRANLLRQERFPSANLLMTMEMSDPLRGLDVGRTDAAVVMTHSYEQDRSAVTALLQTTIAYIGVLGPRYRTARLVADAASSTELNAEEGMRRLHSPVGLDLGADTPAGIALSIIAEIFSCLRPRSGTSVHAPMVETPVETSA